MVKVLTVDDNKDITYTIKSVLEDKDATLKIDCVYSGEECLKYLSEDNFPDIILMDIMMPGMDGMETVIRIKENPEFEKIPIVFLTAKTDELSKGMGEVCADAYIEKPFELEELYKTIISLISK